MASDMAADEAPGQEEAPLDDSLKAYSLSRAEVNSLRTFEDEGSDISSSEILSMLSSELQPAAVMEELGYACAVDSTRCKELLGLFMPLSEKNVAMIIGMVCRTHVGLDDVHGAYSALSSVLFSYVGDASWISSWNQDALIDALKELAPNLDWLHVIENLDHEGLFVSDQKALSLLVSFHTKMCQEEFPVQAICGSVWKNAEGQISLLRQAVVASPEVISFVGSHRKQNLLEGFQKLVHSGSANHAWLSIDLLETLCRLAESGHAEAVRSVLDFPSKNCPELLLAGLAQVKTEWNLIQNEYFALLFPSYLGGNQHANLVMHQLWVLNPETVIQAIVDIHSKDPSTIAKVMDMCEQDTKVLDGILRGSPAYFAIDLAALASRRDSLSLEKWLLENFSVHQDLFFQACLNFLRERLQVDGANAQPGVAPRMGLSLETTATFFKALQSFVGKLSSRELAEEMRRVHQAAVRANPRLLSVAAAEQTPTELFSSDIEEEANSYFQKIYQNQLTVDAIVEMLEKFNESSDIREQHVFSCMIHSLFDEYRFFPRYPERELKITAVLFGKLISHQLVSCITLGVALRYVLDSLRKPPDSRMFAFGLTALEQFRSRLEEWPQYCNHILQIAHMREGHPDLVEYIERCLARSTGDASSNEHQPALTEHPQSSEVPQATNTNVVQNTSATQHQQMEERPRSAGAGSLVAARSVPASSHFGSQLYDALRGQQKAPQNPQAAATQNFQKPSRTTSVPVPRSTPGFGSAINIETLVAAAERRDPIENPSQEVEDKVAFIINNISPTTFESKAKEFLEVVKEKYYAWFAQYIVMKRASIEPNQHDRYLKFLDKLNSPSLNQQILNATYQNCKVLLGSELIKSSSEERSLLKNLGSWLGKLTIGRNKVLKAKEIDPKSLIIEAYEKGLMIAVIPFTSKILEPCQTSAVYQPPNPWTMGILGLLAEIYALPSLKMNLKFDIEVLFKNLNVDMKDVKSATLVKGRARELEGNPDFSNKDVHISQPPPTTDIITSLNQVDFIDMPVPPHPTNTSQQVTHIHTNSSQEEEKVIPFGGDRKSLSVPYSSGQASGTFPLLNSYLILNPRLGQQLHMQLQRITPTAIERAIREIIAPVVERSVTIACMTTKELIQKDFALEADDRSTVNSANLMVASLAGSLAHVTCKEPLRVAMANHIRQSLTAHIASASDLDQTVHVLTNDNLDLACAVIEKAATEKALRDLEETMGPLLMTKRSHRDALLQAYTQGPLSRLPEALRPKPGRLSPAQQRVYEDFSRLPWQNQQTSQAPSAAPVTAQSRGNYNSVFTTSHSAPGMSQPSDLTSDDLDVRTPSPTSFSDAGGRHPDTMSDSAQTLADGAGSEMLLPGKLLPNTEPSGHVPSEACLSIGDAVENYNVIAQKLDAAILRTSAATYSTLPPDHEIRALITDIQDLISQSLSREDAAIAIAQKVFQRLYEKSGSSLQVSTQLAILEAIRDVCKHVVKELTSLVILSDEERKFNRDIVVALVRSELINLSDFLPKLMESRNPAATELAVHIVKTVQEGGLSGAELRPLDLIKDRLLKDKKQPLVKAIHRESDPPGLREQVVSLFDEWARIYNAPGANEKAYAGFISQLAQSGLLKGDDVTERFFRILTELAVAHSLDTASPNLIFAAVDLYAKLVVLLLKYYAVEPATNKVTLLNKILSVTVRVIQRDADEKKTAFQPRPYFRLFFTWFMDFNTPDSSLDFSNLPIQISFSNALYMLQPLNVPGCSFIWLELISHRMFMPKQLLSNSQKGWAYYQRLLVSLFRFMDPYLRSTELSDPIRLLYKGTLRVLLVLLHDFPEFLCDFHFSFCDVIPPTCIQMRNLILSAFPRNMRLPDPFTPNLKVDLLPEISHPPRILSDFEYALKAKGLKAEVDEYLKTRQSLSMFLVDLKQRLMLPHNEAIASGTHYNVPLINSLVLYIGVQAIEQLSKTTPQLAVPTAPITHSAPMDIFQKLILELDTEGRYLFLNAIANQLRYPNNHTHYFSCVLLYLFAEANQEIIQEQITRVLLERLIVNRPHPWGLLITFIELIKNPRYSFWSHNFTRCAPEIERLFDSVARSCMGPPIKSTEDDLASGLGSEGIKG